jgi:hypothetical protein
MPLTLTRQQVGRRGYDVTDEAGKILAKDLWGITSILGQVVAKPELMYKPPWLQLAAPATLSPVDGTPSRPR